ncbi:MAG: NERD domain-containing protein [Eubacterium sp.]|nr:NERD domain-containing protein [Eubacterium sp.]
MATLIKKDTKFRTPNSHSNLPQLIIALAMLAGAVAAGVVGHLTGRPVLYAVTVGFVLMAIILFVSLLSKAATNANIKMAGKTGETVTGNLLAQLPESYTVIMNAVVTYKGEQSEIDNIIVGPTGVFVVETKNHNGTIYADYGAHDWTQHKVGRGGTPYSKTFYSPVKQVGTHVYRLAHFLRENRVRTHVSAAVYFSNPEASVNVTGMPNDIPIFTVATSQELFQYILSGNANLSYQTVQHIVQLLS